MMKQILRGTLPLSTAEKVLNDILSREEYPLTFPNSIGAMTGLTLATMANRFERLKSEPTSICTYSSLNYLIDQCSTLKDNPLIFQYTKGIVYLSYYEWREVLNGRGDKQIR